MDPIIALSRELIQKGSKSFALAAKLLPRSIRYDADAVRLVPPL